MQAKQKMPTGVLTYRHSENAERRLYFVCNDNEMSVRLCSFDSRLFKCQRSAHIIKGSHPIACCQVCVRVRMRCRGKRWWSSVGCGNCCKVPDGIIVLMYLISWTGDIHRQRWEVSTYTYCSTYCGPFSAVGTKYKTLLHVHTPDGHDWINLLGGPNE